LSEPAAQPAAAVRTGQASPAKLSQRELAVRLSYYGIAGVTGDGFRKVPLPANRDRAFTIRLARTRSRPPIWD
jgi:hypothetical protein